MKVYIRDLNAVPDSETIRAALQLEAAEGPPYYMTITDKNVLVIIYK